MLNVRQLLDQKGSEVFSITPEEPVLEAIKRMAERGVGALLVMRGEQLVGLISERDYARKIVLQGKSSRETPVSDIMSRELITVRPVDTIERCMDLMTNQRIRHLPVIDSGRVVGLLSIGDVLKAMMAVQARQIEQLERYITG